MATTTTSVDWSELPKELWPIIGKYLETRFDIISFRSVCSSWRSLLPPYRLRPPPPPLPLTFSPSPSHHALLCHVTTYLMHPITNISKSNPFLMKLEHNPFSGQTRLLHPLTCSPNRTRKEISLLEFRVLELCKSYVLKFGNDNGLNVKSVSRLVVTPCRFSDYGEVCGIFMIYSGGKLGFVRFGDDRLTRVDETNANYDDVVVYKGQCYVVDKSGTIYWVSPDLQVVPFSPPLCGIGEKKYLVECNGDLYVVDQFFEKLSDSGNVTGVVLHWNSDDELMERHDRRNKHVDTTGFRVYKLDQEWGRWVDVKDLGDYMFILSNDASFSVSSRQFGGGVKGNCILFNSGSKKLYSCVFDLDDGRISGLLASHSQMVYMPSSWHFGSV